MFDWLVRICRTSAPDGTGSILSRVRIRTLRQISTAAGARHVYRDSGALGEWLVPLCWLK